MKNLKNDYIVTIYQGLVNKHTLSEIKRALIKDTLNSKVKDKIMLDRAYLMAKRLKSKVDNTSDVQISQTIKNEDNNIAMISAYVFKLMNDYKLEKELSKNITNKSNEEESKNKDRALFDEIKYNRELKSPKVFYLTSEHLDSATDHKPYQGKIYVDEYWPKYIESKDLQDEITTYILQHDVKMWQWVLGRPVWFITRPNCRHYYKSLSVSEVLNKPVKELIEENDMQRTFGDRQYMQTMRYARNNKASKVEILRNAQLVLNAYKERLQLHIRLYNKGKSNFIKMAINKDKLLIEKWSEYIRKLQGQ